MDEKFIFNINLVSRMATFSSFKILFLCIYVCNCVHGSAVPIDARGGCLIPWAGVTSNWELLDVEAGNQTPSPARTASILNQEAMALAWTLFTVLEYITVSPTNSILYVQQLKLNDTDIWRVVSNTVAEHRN